MPTEVNKLKGTLSLGTTPDEVDMSAQVSHVGYPQTVTRDSPVVVLTGDQVQAAATYSYSLTGEVLLDLQNPDGAYYFVGAHQGEEMAFSFQPIGTAGPSISGTVILDGWSTEELAAGSIVSSKFTWPIQGQVTITPPAAA